VQLHIVEELLAMVQPKEEPYSGPDSSEFHNDIGSELMHLSEAAVVGGHGAATMRFCGIVQGHDVLMLVDSGSSHTFVSAGLAARLQLPSRAIVPLRVKVANGGMLECTRELPNVLWSTQGVQFTTSFKILSLGSYDIILGFDWLSTHSPMKVHWAEQTMNFELDGRTVYLSGAQVDAIQCTAVSAEQLRSLVQKSQVARVMHLFLMQPTPSTSDDTIPPAVQPILSEFGHLFEEPQGIPPQCQFDHSIPLLPGAKPVNL
jgi:hypothetical protein